MSRRNRCIPEMILVALLLSTLAPAALLAPAVEAAVPGASQEGQPSQAVQRVRITAERFYFTPSRIKVKKGTIVEIVAESEDTSHGFHIPAAGIEALIPARGKGELRLRFEATQAGTYIFECSRPCGAGHNTMRGVILVEE